MWSGVSDMKAKSGFVLMETIVVISVLCIVLVVLYAAYSNLLSDVKKKSYYDKTEYIFKTNIVRDYLEDTLDENEYLSSTYYVYCRNKLEDMVCYDEGVSGNYENDLFKALKVEAVYIMLWNVHEISEGDFVGFEATTQHYIKRMDTTDEDAFRIIVMYESENNDTDKKIYEYATLRFGSRG